MIIPCHPLHYNGKPLSWEEGFKVIDWELLETRNYSDYECKMACMAEAIFFGTVLSEHFKIIFVKSETAKSFVENILKKYNKNVHVNLFPPMFVNND